MSPRDLVGFAARALRGHRLRTGLSLLGVAIGVAAVVTLTALGEGARRYVVSQFSQIGTNLLIVVPGKTETTGGMPGMGGVPNDLTLADAEAIRRGIPEIDKAAPIAMGTETVANGERRRQVALIGATHEMLEVRRLSLARGRFLPELEWDRGSPVSVLGTKTARELFPGEDPLGRVVRIGDWRMRVIGILGPRGQQLGVDMDDVVIVPVANALRMLNRSSLFRVLLQVRAHADLVQARDKVVRLITERHGEEDVTAITQDAVLSAFSSILGALTMALAGIAAISLAVAGIGIMNVMLVSVSERTREVGLLKAVGAGRGQILLAFLAEAILISSAGGLLGLLLGWVAIRVLVAVYPDLPASPPVWAVLAALALSVAVGALFGVLPARRATRLDPVAALAGR
ncbi:MAG: peptide ABC transporter permease [Acidobacteria bacterium RBG_16_70_10]|nr:MAG: peptide ABC transporter permease [Acidobacteria bacterium RBG_16_70_10]